MIQSEADILDAYSGGRYWQGSLRRAGPAMTAGIWADLSYAAGIPVANYYASTPLASAALNGLDGIDIGPAPAAGQRKYLKQVILMPSTAVGVATFRFVDICLFYPFVDGDGGYQELTQAAALSRYGGGDGCRIMVVSQGVGTGAVNVLVTYTNCDGVSGRQVTATLNLAAPAGSLCSSQPAAVAYANPCGPFLPLAAGCRGVRSIESVEPLSPGGGIAAFVIVKPLAAFGMSENVGLPVCVDFFHERTFREAEIETGGYLGLIAHGNVSAPPFFLAETETIWG